MEKLLTKQVCDQLGIHPSTLSSYVKNGYICLPKKKLGQKSEKREMRYPINFWYQKDVDECKEKLKARDEEIIRRNKRTIKGYEPSKESLSLLNSVFRQ